MEFEKIEELMNMLIGESLPQGMSMDNQPQLSHKQAFSVIWFLQEHLGILPDNVEMCSICEGLFDANHEGFIIDGTDIPDQWQEDAGVTREMLQQNDGAKFCSPECEYKFWMA